MNLRSAEIDMLHGPLCKKLLLFTLPIALSSMVQQLFNAADTAVVSRFGSEGALAAVWTNTAIIALIVTVSSGLSIGANILLANNIGRKEREKIPSAVQTAMALAALIGVLGLLLGQVAAAPLLRLIRTPDGIFDAAALYLRLYMLGYPFLLLYDFGASILRSRGDIRYPFLALLLSGFANVGLNLFFVVALHMNVAGVAIATGISTMLSALLVLRRLSKDPLFRFTLRGLQIPPRIAWHITAFGQTATTFTSQNHAAGQRARCRRILWLCLGLSTVCSSIPIFTIVLFRNVFSGLFTPEAAVIGSAGTRILCILLFEPICNLYEIPAGVLRGSNHALYPAVSTMIGTCAFRIVWICTAFRANPTLPTLYHAFPLSWAATILLVNIGFLLINFTKKPSAAS